MATEVEPNVKPQVPAWRRLLVAAGWFALATVVLCGAVYLFNRTRLMSQLDRAVKELDEQEPGWRWEGLLAARGELREEENSVPRILAVINAIPRGWPDFKKYE